MRFCYFDFFVGRFAEQQKSIENMVASQRADERIMECCHERMILPCVWCYRARGLEGFALFLLSFGLFFLDSLEGWLVRWHAGWQASWLVGWQASWQAGWRTGLHAGWRERWGGCRTLTLFHAAGIMSHANPFPCKWIQ